jgi:hypothetical protein
MTDITRFRGDTAADQITVQNSAGAAIDITGYAFKLTVNSLPTPPSATTQLYSLTGTILDAANGVVEFVPTLTNADQKPATYYYDIQMTDDTARIKTIVSGEYIYTQDITK